jgi:hypothetical protein
VFPSSLEFRTMDKVYNPSVSEFYTPSSELFRFYIQPFVCKELTVLRLSRKFIIMYIM